MPKLSSLGFVCSPADDADMIVCVSPEGLALVANSCIPGTEITQREMIRRDNLAASSVGLDQVELTTYTCPSLLAV